MRAKEPIRNLDSFDIVGKRVDGGLDLVVSAHEPLDGSATTLAALRAKLHNYIVEISLPGFYAKYGRAPGARVIIYLVCPYLIDPKALAVVKDMQIEAAKVGTRIEVRQNMADD